MSNLTYNQIKMASRFFKTANIRFIDYTTKEEIKLSKQLKKNLERENSKRLPDIQTMKSRVRIIGKP